MSFLSGLFSINNEYKSNSDGIYLTKYKVISIFGGIGGGARIKIKSHLKTDKVFIDNKVFFNSKRVYNLGKNKNIVLNITGKNNVIKLNKILGLGKLVIELPNVEGSSIQIGRNNHIGRTLTLVAHNTPKKKSKGGIFIDSNNIFNGHCTIVAPTDENKMVKIGSCNLFATDINIIGAQDHLVFDINTKRVLNVEGNLEIGDKIWIGKCVTILSKAKIPSNSVVAMNSIVTKKFDKTNILLAGIPASIKKENIFWNINNDDSYLYTDNPLLFYSNCSPQGKLY